MKILVDKFVDSILGAKPGTPLHKQQRAAYLRRKAFRDNVEELFRDLFQWLLLCGVCAWVLQQFTVVGAIIFGAIIIGSCILAHRPVA